MVSAEAVFTAKKEEVATNGQQKAEAKKKEWQKSLLEGVFNAEWLGQQNFSPLQYAVPGLIPEGLTLFVSAPKVGKSWACCNIALALATGGRALGRIEVEQRPVLYLALEDGHRRLQDRFRRIAEGLVDWPKRLEALTVIEPGMVAATVDAWLTQVCSEGVVLLDTFGRSRVGVQVKAGESPYDRDYRAVTELKSVADAHPGSSVCPTHHDRKASSEDFIDSVSGTHGIVGAADTVLLARRARFSQEATFQVVGRDIAEGEYALNFTQGAFWALDGDTLEAAAQRLHERQIQQTLGAKQQKIVGWVGEQQGDVSTKEIEEATGADRREITRAAERGDIVKTARGRYRSPREAEQASQVSHSKEEPGDEEWWDK